jgi:hypothetical protein
MGELALHLGPEAVSEALRRGSADGLAGEFLALVDQAKAVGFFTMIKVGIDELSARAVSVEQNDFVGQMRHLNRRLYITQARVHRRYRLAGRLPTDRAAHRGSTRAPSGRRVRSTAASRDGPEPDESEPPHVAARRARRLGVPLFPLPSFDPDGRKGGLA